MNSIITLTPEALNWLGLAFEKKTRISPLSNVPKVAFTQEGLDDLVKQEIVTADKAMTTGAYALLDILAGANRFASVHLAGGSGHVNRVTCWKGDKSVSLDNRGNSFTLSPGNDTAALDVIFTEITGSNRLITSDFTASFDFRSSLVFAALFDLSRIASIHLYADGTPVPDGFSPLDVSKFIAGAENARWLTSHLRALNTAALTASPEEASVCLKNLVEGGIIAAAGEELFTLAYESAQLAASFLFIENTIDFRCGSEAENGSIATAECLFLQAGLHDVIMVDISEQAVEISAVSSFAMIDTIKKMMTAPPSF